MDNLEFFGLNLLLNLIILSCNEVQMHHCVKLCITMWLKISSPICGKEESFGTLSGFRFPGSNFGTLSRMVGSSFFISAAGY